MADEDALSFLKDRVKMDSLPATNRKSRASRRPIDSTPETYMGASVGAKSGSEDDTEAPTSMLSSGIGLNPEDANLMAAPKRRARATRRPRAAPAEEVDQSAMASFLSGMKGDLAAPAATAPPAVEDPIKEEEVYEEAVPYSSPSPVKESKPTPIPNEEPTKSVESPKLPSPKLSSPKLASPKLASPVVTAEAPKPAPTPAKPIEVSKPPSSPSIVAKSVSTEELAKLKKELENTKTKLETANERLEDYDALCEGLVEEGKPDARTLATYVGGLLEKADTVEEEEKEIKKLKSQSEIMQKELDESKKQGQGEVGKVQKLDDELIATRKELQKQQEINAKLKEAVNETTTRSTAEEEEKIASVNSQLKLKDQIIEDLQRQLATAKISSDIQGAATLPAEEEALFGKAEEDLKLMEQLIEEQEEFMKGLEEEMEKALSGMPEGVRAEFEKERQRILKESEEKYGPLLNPQQQIASQTAAMGNVKDESDGK